jgi:hypothetical protein
MPKRVAVIFADSHLRERTWADHPRLQYDSYVSLLQIFAYAIKYELPVIGAGDLIDKARNPSGPIAVMASLIRQLEDACCPFYYIQGQHEMSDTPWLQISSWPKHIHDTKILLGPFEIYGLDFQPAGRLQPALDEIPEHTDILVAHQVWSEFMGSIAAPQGSIRDVPMVSTVITGDYHGESVSKGFRGKDGSKVHVVNPGSTCMQAIDEPPEKFFFILYDDGSFKRKAILTRPFIDFGNVQTQVMLDEVMDTIHTRIDEATRKALTLDGLHEDWEGLAVPIVRAAVSPRMGKAVQRIKEVVGDTAHLFLREIPPEKPEAEERRQARREGSGSAAVTLLSELPDYLEEKDQRHLLEDCQRLLVAPDVEAELARMQEEAIGDA